MNSQKNFNNNNSGNHPDHHSNINIPPPQDPSRSIVQLFLGSEGGGIITAVNQWVPILEQAGWDIRFLVMANGGTAVDMLRARGHEVIAQSLPRTKRFTKLPKLLKTLDPAVIHVHNPSAQLAATIAAKRLHADVIRTVHADMFEEMRGTLPAWKIAVWKRIMRWMIGRAQSVNVVSPHLIPLLPLPKQFNKNKIAIIPNGYDPSGIEKDKNQLSEEVSSFLKNDENDSTPTPMILSMGRLVPVKNFQLLLRAFKRMLKDTPTTKLILAGSGPLKNQLSDLAVELNIQDKVLFLPWVDQIAPLLKRASTIAISSTSECCPMLVLEAMSVSKPVVATRVGGIPYMIENNKNGLLTPSNNENELAQSLKKIILNHSLAQRLGDENHQVLQARYHPKVVAESLANAYNNAMVK